ncbi:uncharacterized protein LOC124454124, partial [Xenia sp. Carnegie-2017]|uniref:uncharacterized protein LOC124454124 n=1 Tax=Xenia sp. Carnegie-2017 TaxID=2897299 RepID=UPI001F03731C
KSSGSNKLACRIGKVPSVAFLVCKRPFYKDNTSCKEVIESELKNILELQRKYHLKTVDVHNKTFENVSCGTASNNTCSGFLECWIDKTLGEFKKPRNHILYGTIKKLVQEVKKITTPQGLNITINDIEKILAFMKPTTGNTMYKQICDLQGFFLKKGGFLVADTPEIKENMGLNDQCFDGEPTTERVLNGLEEIINGLRKNTASGRTFSLILFLNVFISFATFI